MPRTEAQREALKMADSLEKTLKTLEEFASRRPGRESGDLEAIRENIKNLRAVARNDERDYSIGRVDPPVDTYNYEPPAKCSSCGGSGHGAVILDYDGYHTGYQPCESCDGHGTK